MHALSSRLGVLIGPHGRWRSPGICGSHYTRGEAHRKGFRKALNTHSAGIVHVGRFTAIAVMAWMSLQPATAATPPDKPWLIRYDKNPAHLTDIQVPAPGKTVVNIQQGLVPLVVGKEYTTNAGQLTILKGYAGALKGKTPLTLGFKDGSTTNLTLLPTDTSKSAPGIEFSPPAGSYDAPTHVIVTSPSVDAMIRFTTDGSDPTEKSRSIGYRTVFVDRNMTIKARAFTKTRAPGPVCSAEYRIAGSQTATTPTPERVTDTTPGAGSYEVYVGSAFYMDEMLDRSQWSYVADSADGLYHRFLGVDPLGAEGKRKLGAFFKGRKAILEGGLRGPQHIRQDEQWIADVKDMGLTPVATFVNGLNSSPQQDPTDLTVPWQERLALNRKAGIESYTMQAPHRIADEGGWADPRFDRTRRWTLMADGTSADAPTYLFTRRTEPYRQGVYDLIRWTHANKRKFLFIVSPNEGEGTFLQDAMMTVRLLEDNDARPDFYGVTLYGKRALHLVPEAVTAKSGRRTATSTLTGVAYYLLKHARADGGELGLGLDGARGQRHFENPQGETSAPPADAISVASLASPSGSLDIVITNRSDWVDFIPVLRARASAPSPNPTPKFVLNGKDISTAVLGEGHVFLRADRILPGQSRKVTLTLPPTAAGGITLEVLPYPGSRFVRDRITLNL